MSEEKKESNDPSDEVKDPALIMQAEDYLLTSFVREANRIGWLCQITLFVRGTIIAGRLIGGRQYYQQLGEAWDNNKKGEVKGAFFNGLKEAVDILYPEGDQGTNETDGLTAFIHLDDARVFTPGFPGIPENGMLWRGRLEDVSGWSVGTFRAQPPQ